MDISRLTGTEIGKLVARRVFTPSEVLDATFKRIKEVNPKLNAFVYLREEEAYRAAAELDGVIKRTPEEVLLSKYPLLGVPVGLKDFLPSRQGWTNSHGGLLQEEQVDTCDSVFTQAAMSLGAIPIGKTNCPEFAFRGTCDNAKYGPTHNPFDLRRNSGGSSGGSAAAVGGCLVPVCEGSDGGGSIRIPASWCNCFGFKPSVGLIPSVCRPDAWTATHPYCFNGAITRTVEDSAALFKKMSHYDPADPLSIFLASKMQELVNREFKLDHLKYKRIAVTVSFGSLFDSVHEEIYNTITQMASVFENLGAEVVFYNDFKFKHTAQEYADMWCAAICVDTCTDLYLETGKKYCEHRYTDDMEGLPSTVDYWHEIVDSSSVYDYRAFNMMRTEIYDEFNRVLEDEKFDFIVSPVTTCLPVENARKKGMTFGPEDVNPIIGFCETFFTNLTGHPSASVPAGFSSSGLPIGLQITGKRWHDHELLNACRLFEKLTSYHTASRNRIVM